MKKNIGNIKVKGLKKDNPKLISNDDFVLPFYQDNKIYNDYDEYNKFIKGVEKLVRTSLEYKSYKKYLIDYIGLNHCMVFPNITTELVSIGATKSNITIEMHHGPILTLYDCCAIVTDHLIRCGEKVTTPRVANIIIKEHTQNHIQVIMLCDLVHKLVHANKMFINTKQAWGKLDSFIKTYHKGVTQRRREVIAENIELSKKRNSIDIDDILELYKVKIWKNKK